MRVVRVIFGGLYPPNPATEMINTFNRKYFEEYREPKSHEKYARLRESPEPNIFGYIPSQLPRIWKPPKEGPSRPARLRAHRQVQLPVRARAPTTPRMNGTARGLPSL